MSAMFAWSGLHLRISYEAELRCLQPEIRPSGTGVLCGCNVLRLRIGGTVERSSCCLSLVAGILNMGLGACDHGRTNSFFSLDLSVLSNHVPAPGPSFRSYVNPGALLKPSYLASHVSAPSQIEEIMGMHWFPVSTIYGFVKLRQNQAQLADKITISRASLSS